MACPPGRLNVLAKLPWCKSSGLHSFREFSENTVPDTVYGDGDVKYHLGSKPSARPPNAAMRSISPGRPTRAHSSPSTLVGRGQARAAASGIRATIEAQAVAGPSSIHVDRRHRGQGIVAEVFNFSQLQGYAHRGHPSTSFVNNPDRASPPRPADARSRPAIERCGQDRRGPSSTSTGRPPRRGSPP